MFALHKIQLPCFPAHTLLDARAQVAFPAPTSSKISKHLLWLAYLSMLGSAPS